MFGGEVGLECRGRGLQSATDETLVGQQLDCVLPKIEPLIGRSVSTNQNQDDNVPGDDLETGPLEVAVDDGVKVAHVLDEVVLGGKGFLADPAAVVPVEVVVGEELPEVVPEK